MKRLLFLFVALSSLFFFSTSFGETKIEYSKPKPFDFVTNVPHTMVDAWNMSFNTKPETLKTWAAIVSSTVVLYIYDEEILAEFQRWGRQLHIGNDDGTRSYIKVGSISVFRGPQDVGSAFYFLGDGWTHAFIGAGFLATGAIRADNRAMQTGSQIFNGMISSTIANQTLKRSFGRESPIRKSKPRGAWRPFPSVNTYNNNISKYDAMPSGHIMTATMSFVIIDENYPEYRYWFRPVGITWLTILGFQMVNNSVHWASDYPLGIAMGYVFGKAASQYGKTQKEEETAASGKIGDISSWTILPAFFGSYEDRNYGLVATYEF